MAIKYQKADKVRGTSDEGEAGDKIFVEKYNKLAKAFNERLSYGVGDTTWRLFFYAHSLFRSMVLPKFGLKSADLGIIESEAEDGWWKLYSHIVPEPSMFKEDGYKDPERNDTHMFSWPKDNIANKYGVKVVGRDLEYMGEREVADVYVKIFNEYGDDTFTHVVGIQPDGT